MITSCNTPAEKVENAQDNVVEAKQDLVEANQEYAADVEAYRRETAARVAANRKSIAEFNARIESKKQEASTDYRKKIAELEQKNTDLQKRMDDYKIEGKDSWIMFKEEFNRDMEALGKAFKDLAVSSK
jgi:hypothetical protein